MVLAVLAGCGGQGPMAPRVAMPADKAVVAGFAFAATNGALMVSRPVAPLTYADGLPAKRAALSHCARQGRALNPAGFGRFVGSAWVFDGGCV